MTAEVLTRSKAATASRKETATQGGPSASPNKKRTAAKAPTATQDAAILRRAAEAPLTDAMAMTLSHELSQPLAAISIRIEDAITLLEGGKDHDAALDRLRKASDELAYASGVIAQVRKLARAKSWAMEALCVKDVADRALGLLDHEIDAASVSVDVVIAATAPAVRGDAVMLQQVFVNLIRNAIEAMRTAPAGDRRLTIDAAASGESDVLIRVADTGEGLSQAAVLKSSKAFLSSKPDGMGLGLNICRSIVALHRGRLWYQPSDAGGAIFCIALPRAEVAGAP